MFDHGSNLTFSSTLLSSEYEERGQSGTKVRDTSHLCFPYTYVRPNWQRSRKILAKQRFHDNFEVHTHAMAKYLQKAYRTQVIQKFRKTTGFAFEDNESYFAKEEVTHPKYPHPCLVLARQRQAAPWQRNNKYVFSVSERRRLCNLGTTQSELRQRFRAL